MWLLCWKLDETSDFQVCCSLCSWSTSSKGLYVAFTHMQCAPLHVWFISTQYDVFYLIHLFLICLLPNFLQICRDGVVRLWVCYLLTNRHIRFYSSPMILLIGVPSSLAWLLFYPRRSAFQKLFPGEWLTIMGWRLIWSRSLPMSCGIQEVVYKEFCWEFFWQSASTRIRRVRQIYQSLIFAWEAYLAPTFW